MKLFWVMAFLAIFLSPKSANAQQTIFNVPNSDVLDKGSVYFQHQSNFRTWRPGRYYQTGNNFAYGIGYHTELNLTLFNIQAPKSNDRALAFGFNTALPLLKKRFPNQEIKLTVGDMVPASFDGHGFGNWGYSHLSATVPKLHTRLTAGVGAGTEDIFGSDTVHFMGAIEQPVMKEDKLVLMADWMSGSHSYGFLTSGFAYKINRFMTLEVGYQVPNTPQCGRAGFTVQLEAKR